MSRSRKLAAIMFTDIVGYTSLMQESEQRAIEIRNRHRSIFNSLTKQYGGQIIQYYGDGTLSIFGSAIEAVKCAKALQLNFLKAPYIPVRIGLHMGDIILDEEDIIGNAINIASRIESLAVPGSVLISDKICEEVRNQEEIEVRYLGSYHFKNDRLPRKVYALSTPELVVPDPDKIVGKIESKRKQKINAQKRFLNLRKFLAALVLFALIGIFITKFIKQSKAKTQTLPKIEVIADSIQLAPPIRRLSKLSWTAYRMALEAKEIIPNNPLLAQKWKKIAWRSDIMTNPPGAKVAIKPYLTDNSDWLTLGKSPLDSIWMPYGMYKLKISKQGYFETEDIIRNPLWGSSFKTNNYNLIEIDRIPDRMVVAQGDSLKFRDKRIVFSDFFVDQFEVSNSEYKRFVDNGGYQIKEYWTHPFINQEDTLSWEEAMLLFVDQTGQPGPSNWLAGSFEEGKGKFPVTGISWFEAAAYAEFMGKELPSYFHFTKLAFFNGSGELLSRSNINGQGPSERGSHSSMGRFGVYDIAGNVREWLINEYLNASSLNMKLCLGGSWIDPEYVYAPRPYQFQNPFERNAFTGFRCIQPIRPKEYQENIDITIVEPPIFGISERNPVNDAQFEIIKNSYNYQKTPLNANIEYNVEEENWIKQKVTYDPPYQGDRMIIYLYIPKQVEPPYQTIIFWPGVDAFLRSSSEDHSQEKKFQFLVQTGRVVMLPIMSGTFERKEGLSNSRIVELSISDPNFYRDRLMLMIKDVRSAVDYLETRKDFDIKKIGYYGYSQGGSEGPILLALEDRIQVALLASCGLTTVFKKHPEADRANFLPRVKTPALIMNNLFDSNYPYAIAQVPFFELLGTPQKAKRILVLRESGHMVSYASIAKEGISWFDNYLGKPKTKSLTN